MKKNALIDRLFRRIANWYWLYRGAEQGNPERPYRDLTARDARLDISGMDLFTMQARMREFEANCPILCRLADLTEQYIVGDGCPIHPQSSDQEWNKAAREVFDEWSQFPLIDSKDSLTTAQSLAVRREGIEGESFIIKTFGSEPKVRPRIQLIEPHRVASPPFKTDDGNIDGIVTDPNGRKLAYWINTGWTKDRWEKIPADMVFHIYEAERPGQLRGLPWLHSAIPELQDYRILKELEMKAAKKCAATAKYIFTESGELASEDVYKEDGTTEDPDGKIRSEYYRKEFGGEERLLRTGDKVQEAVNNRPSPATKDHWNILLTDICLAWGLPKIVVVSENVDGKQGTVARSDIDIASAFFRSRFNHLSRYWIELRNWVIGWSIRYDSRLKNPPKDWWKCTVIPPRSICVDVGYDTSAELAKLQNHTTTLMELWGKQGRHWLDALDQCAIEAEALKARGLSLVDAAPNNDPSQKPDIVETAPATPQKGTP